MKKNTWTKKEYELFFNWVMKKFNRGVKFTAIYLATHPTIEKSLFKQFKKLK